MQECEPQQSRCRGSLARTHRFTAGQLVTGFKVIILRHPACSCNTGCRRVALWADRPFHVGAPPSLIQVHANVGFGDNCDGMHVEVDWKTGVILDLLGCFTEVVLIVQISSVDPAAANEEFVIKALSACCGAGGARGLATWTSIPFDGPDTVEIEIPPFAYAFAGFFQSAGAAPTAVQWITSGGIVLGPAVAGGGIPEGAVALQFTLAGGATVLAQFLIGV